MRLFIVILVILLTNLGNFFVSSDNFGARIYKNQLRGMHKEEMERLIQESFTKTFDNLYDRIIETAKRGKNEYHFTIMCLELPNENCKMRNGHQVWTEHYQNNIMVTAKSYITLEKYTTDLIDALHETFPDSNITKIYKNCCDYHVISW